MNQHQTFLSACIDLRKRHLLDWNALAVSQQRTWQLIYIENAEKISSCINDETACIKAKRKQNTRLLSTMVQQRRKREQLKQLHQQEFILLKNMKEIFE